ncbi:MAG: AAA family ATPase [Deltaproteobacteria bacterium]|nr:MAG: AAA family ATPase [Deltaproteobacteria bacterium]
MNCPKCQAKIGEQTKFCSECGYDLRKLKEMPSEIYSHPQSYTPKFLADKILTTKDRVEGERKLVTVLFADVAHYTSMAEKLDPEEVHQIMDGCFRILMDEIHRYEGTINQFTGDGVMALFGAPLAQESHEQNACYAALAIQRALKGYSEEIERKFGIEFKMRLGLNSGPVVVGSIGDDLRMDYTAIGDTTNLAARMESMARPGTVLVSHKTYKMVSPYFEFRPLGKLEVKGKEEPLDVYVLRREKGYRPRLGLERKIFSKMMGRDKELDTLERQVLKTIDGKGSVVSIIGEAGIGKSRLVAELKNREVMRRVTLLEGRAISMGRNLSFHPIIDLLNQWAQISKDDGEAESFSKLETAIRSVHPEEVGEILPFVATLMGMKLRGRYAERVKGIEGEALEKLILKNLRELFIKVAKLMPLVIVIEDLHWADTSSIEIMVSLFRLSATQGILFINVFRPRYGETGGRIVKILEERFREQYVEIVLEPLNEKMSEELIDNMLNVRGLRHGLNQQIVQRAGGNPFFIEEVVRSFIDEGAVVLKNGGFEVTEKIDSVVIPHTIIDVLMARIDRLEEKTRSLVKIASVIGRSFFYRILAEVAKTIDGIDGKLTYLKEIQLIRERRRMAELEYLFKHTLTQEVAYESILHQKRKELHLRVANSIEKIFDGRLHEFYGMLSYHYSRGEDLDKAEEYLLKAGQEALRSSASSEALNYYQEGLRLYLDKYGDAADPEKLAIFEKNIVIASFNKGQWKNALKYIDIVLERWGAGSPKNRIIIIVKLIYDLLGVIINLYLPSKRARKPPDRRDNEIFDLSYKKAISLVEIDPKRCFIEYISTLKRLTRFDISAIENGVGMWISASGLFSWTGISFRLSKKMLDYNKDIINKENSKEIFYYELFELIHNTLEGSWLDVNECNDNLVAGNLRIGEIWHVALYLLFHGYIKISQGAFREAEMVIGRLSEISEAYGIEYGTEFCHTLRILSLMIRRKLRDALNEVDAGISFMIQTSSEVIILYYFGFRATIQILLKDSNGAKQSLLQAREVASRQGRVPPIYISSSLLGEFLLDLHVLEQAISTNDKSGMRKYGKKAYQSGARALKNSRKYAFNRTEILRLMGLYFWLVGRQEKAVNFWNRSIKEAERLGARVELARTFMEIGKRFREKGGEDLELNGSKADEYLEKARILFVEMGLREDLDELVKITKYR